MASADCLQTSHDSLGGPQPECASTRQQNGIDGLDSLPGRKQIEFPGAWGGTSHVDGS
jgi:hypothetical protein